jgi:uncharacterized membrane protein YkvA (DUF1232 family)
VAARWLEAASRLRQEVYALYLAYRDPRTPWYARAFAACVVAYAFSPLDLVPDPIPILGYLDDLILLPLGVRLALALIPSQVMNESRKKAQDLLRSGQPVSWAGVVLVLAIWLLALALVALIALRVARS